MIYVVYGSDAFSNKEFIDRIKSEVGPKDVQEANIHSLSASDTTLSEIIGLCSFVPFLAERRLIIIEGLLTRSEGNRRRVGQLQAHNEIIGQDISQEWKEFVSSLQLIPQTTDIIFMEGQLQTSNLLLKSLAKVAVIHESKPFNRTEIQQWIRQRVNLCGKEIENPAVQLLATLIGTDLWSAANEIEKLSLYCRGARIELVDVQTLVNPTAEVNIFPAIDAAIEGNLSKALNMIGSLISKGAPTSYPLGMLGRQIRMLLVARSMTTSNSNSEQIQKRLGIKPGYAFDKTMALAKNFTEIELVKMHTILLNADLAIKTGAINEELSLQIAVAEIGNTKNLK
jgi:DNA polymerase-3 subunit delta